MAGMWDFCMSDPILFNGSDIIFSGERGANLLMSFLLKAKYGQALDPEILFNKSVSDMLNIIRDKFYSNSEFPQYIGKLDHEHLYLISRNLVENAKQIGWWRKNYEGKARFIKDIVMAPYEIDDESLDYIIASTSDIILAIRRNLELHDEEIIDK